MEHDIKSGVKFSDGVKMESYGDQEAPSSNDFFLQILGRSQARNSNVVMYN